MSGEDLKILIVDDDDVARLMLRGIVERAGPVSVLEASDIPSARAALDAGDVSVALVDLRLSRNPDNRDGIRLIQHIRASLLTVPIVVSGAGDMTEVRAAMRAGAFDYILKDDISEELILPIFHELREKQALAREVLQLRRRSTPDALSCLIGTSVAMQRLRGNIHRAATSRRPVLVTGPTGSGKELVVRCLHNLGPHPEQPFIDLNCSALPETLIDSQLFGHEKGAFTGATHRHEGAFAAVKKGTLFLDEIAELPLELQAKLLRALESGQFRGIGASRNSTFEGRVVAATHADLEERVATGKFREDLFYRLNVLQIETPALAARREDIPALLGHFTALQERTLSFTQEAIEMLSLSPWPGNVRELRNLVDRLAVFSPDSRITPEILASLPGRGRGRGHTAAVLSGFARAILQLAGDDKLQLAEAAVLEEAVRITGGNKTAAASLLGVDRRVVERRLRRPETNGLEQRHRQAELSEPHLDSSASFVPPH